MPITFRAAAIAAAAFGFCTAGAVTAPVAASEAETSPVVPYTEHARTELTVDNLGLNELEDPALPAEDGEADAAVADHDAATPPAIDLPDERDGRTLSQLVADYGATETSDAETDCLARAVYYESKGEPLAGQLTVAEVVINRARSGRFPSTICGVVRQPGQFSFVRRGSIPTPPAASRDWRTAVAIARIAMADLADGGAPRALFFHARHVRPGWRRARVATIGNHVFYR